MRLWNKVVSSIYTPIIIGGLILTFPSLIPGRMLYWGTVSLQFIPWRSLALTQINQGILPVWNNLNGMGTPFLANYQLAFFYPPGWLSFVFGWLGGESWLIWAFGLLLTAHIIWAGIGMVRLMQQIGVNETGQIIAGLAFSLSSFWIARASFFSMIWAGSWLPWLILTAGEIADPISGYKKNKNFLPMPFVLCLSMQLLAGHAQLTWYSILLTAIWVLAGISKSWRLREILTGFSRLMLSGILSAGIAAVQLIPTAEYLLNSQRAEAYGFEKAMVYSFWPWRFLTLLLPNLFGSPGTGNYWGYAAYWEDALYIGIIPVVLAMTTINGIFGRKKFPKPDKYRDLIIICWIVILFGFIFSLGDNTPIFPWLYRNVPTFDMFQAPARWNLWPFFCFSLLSGVQAGRLKRAVGRDRRRKQMTVVSAIAIMIGSIVAYFLIPEIKGSFTVSFFIFGLLLMITSLQLLRIKEEGQKFDLNWRWLTIGIIIIDLLAANWGLNPTIKISNFLNHPHELSANVQDSNSRLFIPSVDEYLLKFKRFLRFSDFRPIENISLYLNAMLPNLNILQNISSANNFDPLTPARYPDFIKWMETLPIMERVRMMEISNIGWVENRTINTEEGVSFNSLHPQSLVQWKSCARIVENSENTFIEIEEIIGQSDYLDWLVIEDIGEDRITDPCVPSNVKYELSTLRNNVLRIDVSSDSSGWLLLTSTWYPGWKVFIDGEESPNLHANYLFQAVKIEAGHHEVVWKYRPVSLYIGIGISGFCCLFMLTWMKLSHKRNSSYMEPKIYE